LKKKFILLFAFCMLGVFATVFSTEVYVRFGRNAVLPAMQKGQKKIKSELLPLSAKLISKYGVATQARSMSFMNNDILQRTFKLSVPDNVDVNVFIKELQLQKNVESVERIYKHYVFSVPNDSFYADTVAVYNLKWHLDLVNAEGAWDLADGNPDIKLAVVDNAIWGEHEDLQIPSSLQYDMVADSVGSSYPLDIAPESSIAQSLSHGTHCAGNAGAIKNNGIGVASLASGVTLMACGGWNLDELQGIVNPFQGIIWAAENGAKIISCSWGNTEYNETDAEIIRQCYEKGILVIVAAGNNGKTDRHYPAAYSGAFSVASVDADHRLASGSTRGEWVTIAAPGGRNSNNHNMSVFSTVSHYSTLAYGTPSSPFYHKFYDRKTGTSMACPIVASLAGLMLSKDSTLSPAQIITIIKATAQDKTLGLNISQNSGVIDAAAAMNAVCSKIKCGNAVRNFSAERIYFDSVKVAWSAPLDTYSIKGYAVYRNNLLLYDCYTDTFFYDRDLTAGSAGSGAAGELREYMIHPVYYDSEVLQSSGYASVHIPVFYTLTLSAAEGGSAVVSEAGYPNYKQNTNVSCIATPDSGYSFAGWYNGDSIVSTDNIYSISVNRNISLEARFIMNASIEDRHVYKNEICIYPNPASGYVYVSGLGLGACVAEFEILDMNGRRVLSGTLSVGSAGKIDVSSLKKGAYVLRVNGLQAGGQKKSHILIKS
jgi:subtilisin family serine protease